MDIKYFDYTASTPVDPDVLRNYIDTVREHFANPTSLHMLGIKANMLYEKLCREFLALFKLKNHHVVFTSNATEANNLAISGYLGHHKKGKIITSVLEHPSVYNLLKSMEDKYDICYVNVNENGLIDLDRLKKEINKDTILVSVMWVSNIIGVIEPIKDIIDIVKDYPKARLHVDMVQGMGKVIPDFDLNDIDFMTFSAHKLYGPKGIAGMFVKDGIAMDKVLYGSNVQYGIKPGTYDVGLISALVAAFKKYIPHTAENLRNVKEKFMYLTGKLSNPKIIRNTPHENINYHILNLSVPAMPGEVLVHMLEAEKIYVSTGSACSSKLRSPEKTVFAITKSRERAMTSIRISIAPMTTYQEIDSLLEVLNKI